MAASVNEDVVIDRLLPLKLTEEELLERGDQMAAAELKIEQLSGERSMLTAKINEQKQTRAKLAHTIEAGVENRDVKCKWIGNYATNQWLLIRQDTGAEVEARTMTSQDLQQDMGFDGEDDVIRDSEGDPVHDVDIIPEQLEAPVGRVTKAATKGKKKAAAKSGGGKVTKASKATPRKKSTRRAA